MRTAESPRVAKSEDQQTNFGNTWEDAMHLALQMAGVADPGMLSTVWKPAAPLSKEDTWDLAIQQNAVGLPLEQILREAGYDEEEIKTIMDEANAKSEAQAAMFSVAGAGNPGQVVAQTGRWRSQTRTLSRSPRERAWPAPRRHSTRRPQRPSMIAICRSRDPLRR
jgi:hypothetical protein